MNVLFQQVVDIGSEVFNQGEFFNEYKTWISFFVTLIILFPLSSSKNMDALAFTSSIAVVCVAIFVVACIYLGVVGIVDLGLGYMA
ncbi:uncharacterized protein [Blastocystis hominis]|uniref:Amino acid transporter transmembrane domain-containing protein n=1 Tax=Blastocystis hominis TaxID=12968 RepID=D8M6W7_BLAHO|nr:uncharacterized protein [Blastocystis hominis]CBK23806.2 unnamed protein product [Blastocystis hominis]|eukprot:XP_012897854.1 uncharacterized protein [Blastocystis hominis]